MGLYEKISEIPIINDHTHIFGCDAPEYETAGSFAANLSPESLITQLSWMNMNETALTAVLNDKEKTRSLLLELYTGRRTTFPVRAFTKLCRELFEFEPYELTLENAPLLVDKLKKSLPEGVDELYAYLGSLSNTEVWFCNHGNLKNFDKRTSEGKFRWVPYFNMDYLLLNDVAHDFNLDEPATLEQMQEVILDYVRSLKKHGAVAIKGGAFAYELDRPFAPDVENLKKAVGAKRRLDSGKGDYSDKIVLEDALTVLCAEAAGIEEIPVQIHAGLIWTAYGPTRIPEIKDLVPLFYNFPDTSFVIFHGGYPRTDDLAYVSATMTNVRAEFNWVPFWTGSSFPEFINKWIEIVPNDRILYGSDASGLISVVHDRVTREGLAQAFGIQIDRGYMSERTALQLSANILRNNAIDTYKLQLPKYMV